MPIFIRAFPLSLFTFWRYLILLPCLAIGAFVFSLAGVVPIVGWLVPGMVSVWLTIMGLRCALAARGHINPIDGGTVLPVCFYFSIIFLIAGVVGDAMLLGLVWAAHYAGLTLDPLGLFAGLFGVSVYWSGLLLGFLAPLALITVVFAVPLTAPAASTGRQGWDYTAFRGFGQGLFGLMFVMAVWLFSGHFFSAFGEIWTSFGLIVSMVWAIVEGEDLPWATDLSPYSALRGTLIMAWASSWYFATAVLTWERYSQAQYSKPVAASGQDQITTEDIQALRRARMRSSNNRR